MQPLTSFWTQIEIPREPAETVTLISLLIFFAIVVLTTVILRWLIFRFIPPLLEQHSPLWAGILAKRRVLRYLYLLVPGALTAWLLRFLPGISQDFESFADKAALIYTVTVFVALVSSALLAYGDYYEQHYDFARELPIKAVIQTAIIFMITLGLLAIVAVMLDLPLLSLAGLVAALLAVMTYMFREPILGFAASLQLLGEREPR